MDSINDDISPVPSYSDKVWSMLDKMKNEEVFSISKNVIIPNRGIFIEAVKIYCSSIFKPDNVDIVYSDQFLKKYIRKKIRKNT